MMTPSVQTFIDKVMRCENATTRQVACHEAGHRFFWGITFPEIKTKYSVVDGLPLVTRKSGAHELDLDKMTVEEASRLAYIKLGGIASEMIMFGIEGDAEAIADFITNDFFSDPPTFDWKDDAQFGGDIATTITLIQSKSNPHPESVKQNFKIVLQSCIKIILENKEAFDKECTDAMNLFVLWKKQGRWHLELVDYPQSIPFPRTEAGLEIFFIENLSYVRGVSYPHRGIIIPKTTGTVPNRKDITFKTLAHELGHACGLNDIYHNKNDKILSSQINTNSLWIQEDCTCTTLDNNPSSNIMSVAGYYESDLKHVDLMKRLLMYGVGSSTSDNRGDISLGNVFGINKSKHFVNVKTGLENMNRTPTHYITNPPSNF